MLARGGRDTAMGLIGGGWSADGETTGKPRARDDLRPIMIPRLPVVRVKIAPCSPERETSTRGQEVASTAPPDPDTDGRKTPDPL